METARSLLLLFLYVSLYIGVLVSTINGLRQSDSLRAFIKMRDPLYGVTGPLDLTKELPDFNPILISQLGCKENDKILRLPGQPKDVNFGQFGGYITVNTTVGRALYYYFVEAETDPGSKPLILWFNGGPGCSSLGYGAFEEIGPFLVRKENLIENPYSWNKLGNLLFIESPAGVGFSYSTWTEDYFTTGDSRTTQDAYTFLINWLERFPEYKNRDVYITGESYAGHYVPELAYTILRQNSKGSRIINLKGIAIGNPSLTDSEDVNYIGGQGFFEYLWKKNLISDAAWNTISTSCDFNVPPERRSHRCEVDEVVNYIRTRSNMDLYNIYAQQCQDHKPLPSGQIESSSDPCIHDHVENYLNRPEVMMALHAKVTGFDDGYMEDQPPYRIVGTWDRWQGCRDILIDKWQDSLPSILPILEYLKSHGIQILIYSGDLDSAIPHTATRNSINKMKLAVQKKWHLWGTNEISGSVITYEGNVTFATVRGAGHEVTMNQPRRGLDLIRAFVEERVQQLPRAVTMMNLAQEGINEEDIN